MKKCTSKQWDTCRVEKMGCYGCAYNDNREEDIKIIEEEMEIIEHLCTDDCINKSTVIQPLKYALENLIKGYKELKQLEDVTYKTLKDTNFIHKNYIPKSLVREKIEYYKKIYNAVGVRILELLLQEGDK